jgi:uncharacterized protein (TIGR02588 family)
MARKARPTPRTAASKPRKPSPGPAQDIPALEWLSAGIGLVLASTAIGLTAWDALFGVEGPPVIEVKIRTVTPTPHGYVVQVEAFNRGGEPAAQVQIEGVMASERSSLVLDYIPEQSHASGGLVFKSDPRAQSLDLRATGFADAP